MSTAKHTHAHIRSYKKQLSIMKKKLLKSLNTCREHRKHHGPVTNIRIQIFLPVEHEHEERISRKCKGAPEGRIHNMLYHSGSLRRRKPILLPIRRSRPRPSPGGWSLKRNASIRRCLMMNRGRRDGGGDEGDVSPPWLWFALGEGQRAIVERELCGDSFEACAFFSPINL